jgi:PPOX class probable F420-dependent enzyme
MNLDDAARELIGAGTDATLVTLNPDGSPQVTVVWMALESTPDGDELVSAHLTEYRKTRNIRRDPRVAVTIL